MNYIDVVLWLVVLLAIWSGWQKGFIIGIMDLIAWIGSIIIAFLTYQSMASFVDSNVKAMSVWTAPIAFIVMLLLSRFFISLVLSRLIPAHLDIHRQQANRVLGVLPGFASGLINAAILAAILLAFPLSHTISATTRESNTANFLGNKVDWLGDKLAPVFEPVVKKSVKNIVVRPDSDKTVLLNFKVTNVKVREDLETRMIALVNEERSKKGLKPLIVDAELAIVGRQHSKDMFARGYFSHYSLEGKTIADRLKDAKIRYLAAGENLALAQTLAIAHNGLMESPGHRANILEPQYGRIGIGILDGGIYGLMITQVFKN